MEHLKRLFSALLDNSGILRFERSQPSTGPGIGARAALLTLVGALPSFKGKWRAALDSTVDTPALGQTLEEMAEHLSELAKAGHTAEFPKLIRVLEQLLEKGGTEVREALQGHDLFRATLTQ